MNTVKYFRVQLLVLSAFFSMGSFLSAAVTINEEMQETKSLPRIINTGVTLNQQIASSSLNNGPSAFGNGGSFVITKAGRYFFSNDVVANPVAHVPIIYIASNDVVIDMGGKTLTMTATSNVTNCVGIKVAPGMRNIVVCNGTICGAGNYQSTVPNPATSPYNVDQLSPLFEGIVVGDPDGINNTISANIVFDSVVVTSCAKNGIAMYNCRNVAISDVVVQGISDGGLSLDQQAVIQKNGIYFYKCNEVSVKDSSFDGVTLGHSFAPGSFAVGVNIQECANFVFKNVSASDCGAIRYGSGVGIWLSGCTSSKFENVRAVGNFSNSADSDDYVTAGVLVSIIPTNLPSSNNIFTDCYASNNNANSLSTTCSAYGFRVTYSCDNNTFIRCTASGNNGICGSGFGFFATSSNTLRDCLSTGNFSASPYSFANASGFSAQFGTGNSFISCEARGNNVMAVTVDGVDAYVDGVPAATPFNTPNASGIYFRTERYSNIRDCLFTANYTNLTKNQAAYGIAFYGSCRSCLVSYSEMNANKGVYQYGFKDFARDCTTLLRGNIAFAQGQCFSGGQSSFTDTGAMNYMIQFTEAPGVMDVQNLVKEADIANMNAFEGGSTKWFNFSILESAISG